MPTVLITGSAGLVGSAATAFYARLGWRVVGVDNDQRQRFFGAAASTGRTLASLQAEFPAYLHHDVDIRDEIRMRELFASHSSDIELVVHAAAQPSHDAAAGAPLVDFQTNASASLLLLELTRQYCAAAVFIYVSTNKVYGDTPNRLPFVEHPTRWELDPKHEFAAAGIPETMGVDQCLHSVFGCSKLAADVLVQEYGRYFGLKTGSFRCGCITGSAHAAVEQHGFFAYLMWCAAAKRPYVIHGYGGKQVRDNIHASDLVLAFDQFRQRPRAGEVYNLGGGQTFNCSVTEAIGLCEQATGNKLSRSYQDLARAGDHIWWVTDVGKFKRDYPEWRYQVGADAIVADVYAGALRRLGQG